MQPNVLANEALQHLGQVRDDVVEIDVEWLHHLLAAEEQQLAREVARTLGRGADLVEALADVGRDVLVLGGEVGLHHDHGENIVEVVRDAAGELADGLHFLRLAQLLLDLAPFADVLDF